MDRVAALITRAAGLQRRIYASLPFEERLARLFVKLALDTTEVLGRAIGAEFLLRGVTDMPDPGPRWDPQSRNPAATLPHGYMSQFAKSLYGLLMKKFHDPELADDAIQTYLAETIAKERIKPVSRSAAESYVRDGIMKAALYILRQKRREEQHESLHGPAGDEGRALEEVLEDPSSLKSFQRELSPRVWKLWMDYLGKRLHPDIPTYIALSMQGYSDREIIGDQARGYPGMLPTYKAPASGPNAYLKFVYQIPDVSKKFFQSINEEAPVAV